MASPFLGELRVFSFNFAPKGWSFCNGQLLNIQQNAALFSLLGTIYGGDGVRTFGLPNLQANVALHQGNGYTIGQRGGEAAHTLTISEMPTHTHNVQQSTDAPTTTDPVGALFATSTDMFYIPRAGQTPVGLAPAMVSTVGGSQPHENRQPFLVMTVCIALTGIFPTRS